MTSLTPENRTDPQFSQFLFEALCPSPKDRFLVLQQLIASINVARKISETAWSLTLTKDGFRLNVGPVEAMTFRVATSLKNRLAIFELRLLLYGLVGNDVLSFLKEEENVHTIFPASYKSVPQPQFVYMGLGDFSGKNLSQAGFSQIKTAIELLQPLHKNYVEMAAMTPSGTARKNSNFSRSNSTGLYEYAKRFIDNAETIVDIQSLELSGPNISPPKGALKPQKTQSTVTTYVRSEAVRQWVLCRAQGFCECCTEPAPFTYASGQPYLEVHHIKQLAEEGSDRVSNAVALCPNCHRRLHFGIDKEQLREKMLTSINELAAE